MYHEQSQNEEIKPYKNHTEEVWNDVNRGH